MASIPRMRMGSSFVEMRAGFIEARLLSGKMLPDLAAAVCCDEGKCNASRAARYAAITLAATQLGRLRYSELPRLPDKDT
jgi:hypothetical protein